MSRRSVLYNDLSSRIEIIEDNLCNAEKHLGPGMADVVISNPPYVVSGGGIVNPTSKKAISRHEILCTLEDVIRTASRLLKQGGAFYMVHRPNRLVDIMCYCRQYKLEPKSIQFVQPNAVSKPNILLVKCVKNSGPELKFKEPLIVYKEDGS